ncbi:MAG: PHB depolymerase family esterase [Bacteroidales bacterium]
MEAMTTFPCSGSTTWWGTAPGTALEVWAAAHPLQVISQVYVETGAVDPKLYTDLDTVFMDGRSSGYVPLDIPADLRIPLTGIPVPTAIVHSDPDRVAANLEHWKKANDVDPTPRSHPGYFHGADLYLQRPDSKAWATAHGGPVSEVLLLHTDSPVLLPSFSETIHGFLSKFVSYDNTTAYGNHLALRKEYGEIRTMLVAGEIREFMVYEPKSASRIWPEGAPVVFVFAGNSQTDKVFFHNTLWWQVADREGFLLAIPCETYSRSSNTVSHANTGEFYEKLAAFMKANHRVDPTRFYATGQSAGSFAVQGFGITHPGYFAAIASTSGLSHPGEGGGFGQIAPADARYETIPNYCIIGEGDIDMMTGTLWDETRNMLDAWAAYYLEANEAGPLGNGANLEQTGRFQTWTWTNAQGFPVFKVGRTLHRAHNCIPAEMPLLWDFLKHWSLKDGVRCYDGQPIAPAKESLRGLVQ